MMFRLKKHVELVEILFSFGMVIYSIQQLMFQKINLKLIKSLMTLLFLSFNASS